MQEIGCTPDEMANRMTPEQFSVICDAIIDSDLVKKAEQKRLEHKDEIVTGDDFLNTFGA